MYDYHVHSQYSGDCAEKMEDTILEAIKRNGKQICFTDHLDYDYPSHDNSFDFDEESFSCEIEELREKYKNQIIVQKGIELGLQPHVVDQCEKFLEIFNPDFVLGSFHCCEKKDLFNGDYFIGKDPVKAWNNYFDEMIVTLNKFNSYSVIGHIDILKRYNEDVKKVPLDLYKNKLIEVLKIIIRNDKGIEVNMSGLRSDLKESLPNRSIIELYYALGGKIITVGSDAHFKKDVYSHYKETLQMLKLIGFDSFTVFDKMIPKQIKIQRALDTI